MNLATRSARAKQRCSVSEVPKLMVILSEKYIFLMLSGLFPGVLRKLLKGFEKHFFELTIRVMACLKLLKRESKAGIRVLDKE